MNKLKFLVILGSVRENRIGDRVVKLFLENARKLEEKGYSFEVMDARKAKLPVVDTPLHFYPDQTKAPEVLHNLNDSVKKADGYFLLTAEYNRLPCPGLINLLDFLPPASFGFKPSGLIGYSAGPQGGAFALSSLRNFMSELGTVTVKHMTAIPTAHVLISEDGKTEDRNLIRSLDSTLQEVVWYADALKIKRERDEPPK